MSETTVQPPPSAARIEAILRQNQIVLDLMPLQDPTAIKRLESGQMTAIPELADALLLLVKHGISLKEIADYVISVINRWRVDAAEVQAGLATQIEELQQVVREHKTVLVASRDLSTQHLQEQMTGVLDAVTTICDRVATSLRAVQEANEKSNQAAREMVQERERHSVAMQQKVQQHADERIAAHQQKTDELIARVEAKVEAAVARVEGAVRKPSRFMTIAVTVVITAAAFYVSAKLGFVP